MEDLQEDPLLHPADLAQSTEIPVAHDRIRDRPQGGHDRIDEARLAAGSLEIDLAGMEVDQVVDDREGRPDLLAPRPGRRG
jgi:hypothetical protein